jgi:four helix bundle protein
MFRYQSLEAWKRAHATVVLVLRTTDEPRHPRVRPVFDQLRRAVISIEANIVEGYALGTTALYQRHLRIAMGSAAEAECLVRVAREMEYLERSAADTIDEVLSGAMRALHGLIRHAAAPRGQPAAARPTPHIPRR